MKILHVCLGNFFIDDYSYQENMLAKFHFLQGFQVTVLASLVTFDKNGKITSFPNESNYKSSDGFNVIRVNYKKGIYKLNKRFRRYDNIYSRIVKENPDIIFIHGCQFMDIKFIKKYAKTNKSVKIFVDNHADFVNSAKNWLSKNILHKVIWKNCAQLIEPYTDKFYGVTPNRCDFLENVYKIPKNKIELLVMGVDDTLLEETKKGGFVSSLRNEMGFNESDFIVITGGKIDYAKNIHLLMQSIIDINNTNIKLLIFGNIAPEIKDLFESLNSHCSIHYLGWKSHKEKIDLFAISNLAVFPGTHSVLWEEVVGTGIPAIFKYWEGMTHVDLGGNCTFLKENSTYEIRDAILSVYDNKGIYNKMKFIAELKKESFSYSFIAKKAIRTL